MANIRTFGEVLRDLRKRNHIQLGTFAGQLGVAPSYLSDVELGRRGPFLAPVIERIAALLDLSDAEHNRLLRASSVDRESIELPLNVKIPESVELGATLMR